MTNKQPFDDVLIAIADYVCKPPVFSNEAYQTARASLADALGCAIYSLKFKECTKLLGPVVPGTIVPNGCRIPGTSFVLDPVRGAFNIGTMIRWLDYNDTWLAAEWGHPSDNIGGILAVADYVSRKNIVKGNPPLTVKELLDAIIQAHEIQGILALENSFNRQGFDHVILVKIATTAVVTSLLGGTREHVLTALSNAFIDTGPLRTYRHAPNTGSRKSWAAGDATSRGVFLAFLALQGEMGYSTALSTPTWGFNDVILKGNSIVLPQPFGCYVMENVLFKVAFPAEFHAQTAVECALLLHPQVINRMNEIQSIDIVTHESAIRIIDKKGPLHNPADRDHCLQYMVAIGLLYGHLSAHHYEEDIALDPRINALRLKMHVIENKDYSRDYLDPQKRSIANAITIRLKDGTVIGPIEVEYPFGHRKRRQVGLKLLFEKFDKNLYTHFIPEQVDKLRVIFQDHRGLTTLSVPCMMDLFAQEYVLKQFVTKRQ